MEPIGRGWMREGDPGKFIKRNHYKPPPSFYTDWPRGFYAARPRPRIPAYLGWHNTVRASTIGIGEWDPSWTCKVLYKMPYPSPRPRLLASRREKAAE